MTDRPDGAPAPGLNDLYLCTSENGRLVSTPPEDAEKEGKSKENLEEEERRSLSRGFVAVMLLQCYSRGNVSITSTEPLAMPDVAENMLSDTGDLARMRYGVRKLAEFMLHPSMLQVHKALSPLQLSYSIYGGVSLTDRLCIQWHHTDWR